LRIRHVVAHQLVSGLHCVYDTLTRLISDACRVEFRGLTAQFCTHCPGNGNAAVIVTENANAFDLYLIKKCLLFAFLSCLSDTQSR